jgi:hypothetical protein
LIKDLADFDYLVVPSQVFHGEFLHLDDSHYVFSLLLEDQQVRKVFTVDVFHFGLGQRLGHFDHVEFLQGDHSLLDLFGSQFQG